MRVKRADGYFHANYRVKTGTITSINYKNSICIFTSDKKGSN